MTGEISIHSAVRIAQRRIELKYRYFDFFKLQNQGGHTRHSFGSLTMQGIIWYSRPRKSISMVQICSRIRNLQGACAFRGLVDKFPDSSQKHQKFITTKP